MVSDAAATKAPIAKAADRVSGIFVPAVITVSIITTIVWLLAGQGLGFALARGISVLVISCPCALGLATPVAIMVGNGMGAKNGILFKTAVSLEETGKMQIIALDKTGTITEGQPKVTDIVPADGYTDGSLLSLAHALEAKSEHPLAKAVLKRAEENQMEPEAVTDFKALPGNGLSAVRTRDHHVLTGGSLSFISSRTPISQNMKKQAEALAEEGKTPLLFTENDRPAGIIAVADTIKEDSPQAIKELKNMGIHVVMLTGDKQRVAEQVAEHLGINQVFSEMLPADKVNKVEEMLAKKPENQKLAFVGDGINDAPVLRRADIGIAMGAMGSDAAIEAADIVLMDDEPLKIAKAIRISRKCLRIVHENIVFALGVKILCLILGALGIANMWLAIFADVGVMILAVLNAIRALFVKKL